MPDILFGLWALFGITAVYISEKDEDITVGTLCMFFCSMLIGPVMWVLLNPHKILIKGKKTIQKEKFIEEWKDIDYDQELRKAIEDVNNKKQ